MKRLLSLVVIVLACKAAAWAQPSLIFPPSAPSVGESFCVDVKVKDFTDILSMDFSLQWDPQTIQFERVEGFGLPSFNASNFNQALVAEGKLSVSWLIAQCSPSAVGVTSPDGTTIFRLCFKALGGYGESSEIILDPEQPIRVTRVNACPNNIGMISKNGLVSIGVRPLTLIASQERAAKTGDLVCVDFTATGFDNLTSMQFSMQWDPAILDFVNVQGLENLINLAPSNFGIPDMPSVGPGRLTVSWSYVDPSDPGVSLPDSSVLFQACFRVTGACEKSTAISFVDSPTPFEFTNTVVEGFELKVLTEPGRITVGACAPVGLKLFADCGPPANPNDEVCVKISTADFLQVREFSYNLEWNEKILSYVGVRNVNGAIPGFDFPGDFNIANVSNGVLGVNWSTNNTLGASLPNGGAGNLFEVCFKVIGVEGGSPVTFTGPSKVVTFNNPNLGINPSNCAVEVIKPQGVIMTLANTEAPLGDTACIDVSVANFKDITRYQISLAWEPNHMEFVGINNINLPEASLSNFSFLGVDGGALTFEWEPNTAQTLVDNTVIFKACFEMTGTPQDCDDLQVVDQPLKSEAFNTSSNGNNIGVVSQPGEVCILFPEGFFLDVASVTGDTGTVVCLPMKVSSFDNIVSAQFPISWEPSALEFVGVQNPNTLPGLSDASFNISSTGVGILNVNWTNGGAPVTVADSTTIFELCFTLVGSPDNCYEVRIGEPDPVVTTANGGGSLLSDPGEVCIRGRLTLVDTIIRAVSCPGTDDGEITLVVTGGRGPLGYTWETIPQRFGPTARNLPTGLVAVTVFDNSNPALILRDTFEIPMSMDLPTSNAGVDKDFTCNPPIVQLQGEASTGPGYSYLWRTTEGQLTPNVTSLSVGALAPGSYILEVKNDETGCVARDTARVIAVNFPTASAGQDRDFACDTESVQLDGSGSSTGTNIRYKWTALPGGIIVAGQDTLATPSVSMAGTYVVAVTNSASGCVSTDTVIVRDIAVFPNANAGQDVELPCGTDASVEIVSQSDNPETVNFQWLDLNGQVLSTSLELIATATGTYILQVTNPSNNCSALDSIQVMPSAMSPVVALDSLQQLTCTIDTLTLNANVSNSTNFVFQWTANNGGQIIAGTENTLTPKIALPGTYELLVRDTTNQCVTTNLIIVEENKEVPIVEAGQAEDLSCQDTERELDGVGSSTGADFTTAWKLNGTVVASDTLKVKVTTPGTYYLDVTNKTNGCVATDSVQLDANVDIPQVILPIEEQQLTCKDSVLTITAMTDAGFTIEWTSSQGGTIISGENTTTITTSTPGIYQVKVTNPANGCEGSNDLEVFNRKELPTAAAGEDQKITCTNTSVTLNGNASSVGSDFSYEWRAVDGGQTPSPNNAPQVSVSASGTYELVVTNTRNNCVSMDQVVVVKNDTLPQLVLANIKPLSCQDTISVLDASATTPNNVSIQWNGLNGGVPRQTNNPLIFEVTQKGDYEVIVTNPDNGCVTRQTVMVTASDTIPQLAIAVPTALTCTQNTTTLDASSSTITGTFTTQWTAISGGSVQTNASNPLRATANGAGTYQLTVTVTETGCKASAEVKLDSPEFPMASAAADKPTIGCGENTMLNSSGSSSGAGINYRWTVVSGTGTITNPTAQNIQVDKAGNYQLVVTNSANGCADTAVVNITFNIQFELANAGADLAVCEPAATLTANLPAGTTGLWKSLTGGSIPNSNQAAITVNNLQTGDNRFVWALSAPGCGEYSADTVAVKVESAPTAANDNFTLKAGQTQGTILVTSNDNLSNINSFTVTIAQNPVLGGIGAISPDGRIGYLIKAGVFGQDEFTYKLCSTNCPSFCDEATVSVFIEEDKNFQAPPRTNAITPNGDGVNEQLVFEELLINPDQYPDNELIIFNRWGDIVFTARPYANTWDGTNETGLNLPEGTYYYILRLNISEGIIIRGDVTIVR